MKMTLDLKNVTQEFLQGEERVLQVLKDINVTFTQGKRVALTGASGSGKSTLLALLAGFEKPTYGKILFNNHALNNFDQEAQQRFWLENIGFLFQSPYLSNELTVLENVIFKGLIARKCLKDCYERGKDLLAQIGLLPKAQYKPSLLSGGEQQRVALLRALFLNPSFLLADEPTAHLDEETKKSLIALLLDYQQEQGMGLIVSSHDKRLVEHFEQVYILHNGSLILV